MDFSDDKGWLAVAAILNWYNFKSYSDVYLHLIIALIIESFS